MIKLKRKILNYSQKDVGNKIDTPQQSISLIEKYERCPSLDTFIKYAGVMGYEVTLIDKNSILK